VVVDVDDELPLQIDEAGPRDVRALDDEDGVVLPVDAGRDAHELGAGEPLVGVRDGVAHDDLDLLVERAQQPKESERRAEAVAVGADVRRDREAALRLDQFNHLTEHVNT
jgi:hypothetical protein